MFAIVRTVTQHVSCGPEGDTVGDEFEGLSQVVSDLRGMRDAMPPLLVGDGPVRFANGVVNVFVVIVVTRFIAVEATVPVVGHHPSYHALFGLLLALEMVVALLTMVPVARQGC